MRATQQSFLITPTILAERFPRFKHGINAQLQLMGEERELQLKLFLQKIRAEQSQTRNVNKSGIYVPGMVTSRR